MLHMDRVLEIISEHSSPSALFVVVSSIGKTTDWLRDEDIQRVRRCYLEWAQTLNISSCIDSLWDNAQSIIDGHNRVEQRKDLVLSYGEQCSAYCLVSALQPALILLLGIAVGGIIIVMLSAVFSMNTVDF